MYNDFPAYLTHCSGVVPQLPAQAHKSSRACQNLQKYIIVFNSASYCNLILCGYFFQLEQKILIWCALEGPVLENNWIKFVGPSISDH